MFVAATTRCFAEKSFQEACRLLTDLEYDKLEIWIPADGEHLSLAAATDEPDEFVSRFRESTRLTPVALFVEGEVGVAEAAGLSRLAKLLKITQLTISSAPLASPFNAEIERLKSLVQLTGREGIRLSIKTEIGRLSEDPNSTWQICKEVPGLSVTLDPSHLLCGPHADMDYDRLLPFVSHMHLRDSVPGQMQVSLGLGEIDYARLIQQLEGESYDRALSVDLTSTDELDITLELRKQRMLLDTLL